MARSPWMYLAYFLQFMIGMNVLYAAVRGAWNEVPTGLLLFFVALVPYLITWRTKITFPWFVYFLVSLALLIHTSGYIQGRYLHIPNWDVLAHTVSGSMLALLGFVLILFIDRMRGYKLDPMGMGAAVFLIGLAGEYLWEVWEFLVDQFFGGSLAGKMQADNTDTMTDMIFVMIPSLVIAIIAWYYLEKNGKDKVVDDMVKDSDFKF
ncbi:MAG: hypothetical protein LUQ49_03770 [Methanomicrobiales archaeon]|nr:hypothetical protein [Methanomicrobiales archaeon]